MKLFTVFCVLVVGLMLVHIGDSCGGGTLPLRVSRLHLKPVPSTTRNKTAVLQIIHPQEGDSGLSSIVEAGALRGLEECQKLFGNRDWPPWNCPVEMYKKLPMFDNTTYPYATSEIAFIHAISAAAITYEITLQCTLSKIPGCGCARQPPKRFSGRDQIPGTWGGCGDNIEFGVKESKRFTDQLEKENDAVKAVNLHNNEVGREVVRTSAELQCKCHPTFNSECRFRTCWMELPPFEVIVSKLKNKYHYVEQVWLVDNKLRVRHNNQFLPVSKTPSSYRPDPTFNLVYLDSSPDTCVGNDTLGHPGMLGHSCERETSKDKCELFTDACKLCKLRVKIVEHYRQVQCGCKFVYCCKVECRETCTEKYSVLTCSL